MWWTLLLPSIVIIPRGGGQIFHNQGLTRMPPPEVLTGDVVYLGHNAITYVGREAVPPGVLSLNLSHNRISHTDRSAFGNCVNLHTLDVSYNALACFPDFMPLRMLAVLVLKHNMLRTGCTDLNEKHNFTALRHLDVSGNELDGLPEMVLGQKTVHVKQLHVGENCITCLGFELFQSQYAFRAADTIYGNINCVVSAKDLPIKCDVKIRTRAMEVIRIDISNESNWKREEWAITLPPGEDSSDGGSYMNVDGTPDPETEQVGPEMAFLTCIMIFVCTTCLGSVLYLGRKRRMADESSEYFSEYDSEFGRYENDYSEYNGSSYHSSYSSRSGSYASRDYSRRSSYASSDRGSVY